MRKLNLLAAFIFGAGVLPGATVFTDFGTAVGSTTIPFTLNGVTGTITATTTPGVAQGGGVSDPADPTGSPNFPDTFYTPTPPDNLEWAVLSADGIGGPDDIVVSFLVTFTSPVSDISLHFLNLDASRAIFTGATDGGGSPIDSATLAGSLSRLSGNDEFETSIISFNGSSAFAANSTPHPAQNIGCDTNAGSNPVGGCGSLLLSGTYSSFTFVYTDVDPSPGSGDGNQFQMSVQSASAPEPSMFLLAGSALLILSGRLRRKMSKVTSWRSLC